LQSPSVHRAHSHVDHLKLLPFWGELCGGPRFEEIVASFAPKE
jgi:hypothetical protein